MAKIELFKRILIKDKNGRIKYDSGLVPSNSFVMAFLELLYTLNAYTSLSINDISDAAQSINYDSANMLRVGAADDDDTYGIVVGTGTTAESNTDYALATQIAHGTGSGQLDYGAHGFTAPAVVGSNVGMVVSRTFYNGSGASITVREIGVYCLAATYKFCALRDVLITPEAVANTETLTVQYTFRTTV